MGLKTTARSDLLQKTNTQQLGQTSSIIMCTFDPLHAIPYRTFHWKLDLLDWTCCSPRTHTSDAPGDAFRVSLSLDTGCSQAGCLCMKLHSCLTLPSDWDPSDPFSRNILGRKIGGRGLWALAALIKRRHHGISTIHKTLMDWMTSAACGQEY